MWRNYLASALGNLARNKLYAAINIIGLAIGMAAALLLALYIRDELTFDRFFPGWKNVYLVTVTQTAPDWPNFAQDQNLPYIAPILKLEFPQIQSISRVMPAWYTPMLKRGEVETHETGFNFVDPDFFAVMSLKAIAGDPRAALRSPDAVVLTRAAARRYFGRDAPVGETLLVNAAYGANWSSAWASSRFGAVSPYNTSHPMRVAAVVEDLPSNSSFKGEVFASNAASFSSLAAYNATAGGPLGPWRATCYILVRLKPGASAAEVRRGLAGFVARHMPASAVAGLGSTLHLLPISDLHLSPPSYEETAAADEIATRPRGDPKVIAALAAVAALIVLSASINFVALMTAQAGRRAVETGVRKAAGAFRRDLIVQFLGEALIYVVLAMAGAVVLAELFLPLVNAFLQRRMAFDYLHDPALLASLVGAALILGVGAGFYPALVLSSFRPAVVLKGGPAGAVSAGAGRQALVALQFALMIGLIISTVTLWRQTVFALHSRLRVDGSRVLLVRSACGPAPGVRAFRELVAATPGVQAQACSSTKAFNDTGDQVKVAIAGRPAELVRAPVGFGYLAFYGLKPLAGRFLVDGRGLDGSSAAREALRNPSVVINETALRRLGFSSPAAAVGKLMTWTRPTWSYDPHPAPYVVSQSEIVGVAPDFSTDARQPVPPRVMYYEPLDLQMLHVRLDGGRMPETLAAIDKAWRVTGKAAIQRRFLDQTLQAKYADVIVQSTVIGVGAGLALLIAALGLLGLAAHAAEQRTKEIGVRKAMGASTADIVRLLLWQFSRPVLVANLIAWPLAWWAMNRWLSGFAYHVDLPAWLFLAAGGAALVIACATVLTHALLVARAAPATALRYE